MLLSMSLITDCYPLFVFFPRSVMKQSQETNRLLPLTMIILLCLCLHNDEIQLRFNDPLSAPVNYVYLLGELSLELRHEFIFLANILELPFIEQPRFKERGAVSYLIFEFQSHLIVSNIHKIIIDTKYSGVTFSALYSNFLLHEPLSVH